eukprot:Em0023g205a
MLLDRVFPLGFGIVAGLVIEHFRSKPTESVNVDEEKRETTSIFKYGIPHSCVSTHAYSGHALAYDRSKKIPVWVAERITKENLHGKNADRENSKFRPDPALPVVFSATNADYWDSGWSRGHMAPAGNYKHSQESMNDTFYLTNILPQDIDNNAGYWNRFENFCRDLALRYDEVSIISGPAFPVQQSTDGKKFVHYDVIGENNVAVPSHLYKLVLAESDTKPPIIGAFVVPNKPLRDEELSQFKVSLEQLEAMTGIIFHSKLDRSKALDLCETQGCKLLSHDEFSRWFYTKRIRGARKLADVERAWKELTKKGIEPDEQLIKAYATRKQELGVPRTS